MKRAARFSLQMPDHPDELGCGPLYREEDVGELQRRLVVHIGALSVSSSIERGASVFSSTYELPTSFQTLVKVAFTCSSHRSCS